MSSSLLLIFHSYGHPAPATTLDSVGTSKPQPAHMHLHGDVLQRALRQIRHPTDVRLLSGLGSGMGVQEKGKCR